MPTQHNNEFEGAPYGYSGPAWSDESGLAKWTRENPDEVRELDRALAKQLGDDMRTVSDFLAAHPTPWRYIREDDLSDAGKRPELIADGYQEIRDVVEDVNGNTVIVSWDRDETASHIEGDVRALVDFVNAAARAFIR